MNVHIAEGITVLVSGALAALLGCGGAPPAPAPSAASSAEPAPPPKATSHDPPTKEPLQTGSDCLKALAQCDGGECVLTIKNDCDQALSCDATMTTTCKSNTDMIEAARRKRETFAAKTEGEMRLVGDCASGVILHTAMKSIACK